MKTLDTAVFSYLFYLPLDCDRQTDLPQHQTLGCYAFFVKKFDKKQECHIQIKKLILIYYVGELCAVLVPWNLVDGFDFHWATSSGFDE